MTSIRVLRAKLLTAALCVLLPRLADAQCGLDWQPGAPAPGPTGPVLASARLANGDLLVGGVFAYAGGVQANHLARYDGTSWSAVGAGANSTIDRMLALPNGDIVVAGQFTSIGGVAAARVARFDGVTFHAYGTGIGPGLGRVTDVVHMPNGDLLVSGNSFSLGTQVVHGVVRWDGTAWSAFDPNIVSSVSAMALLGNGDLVFGGMWMPQGAGFIGPVLRFDGTNYTPVPAIGSDSVVEDVLSLGLGQFAICGELFLPTGQTSVGLFNGTTTVTLAPPAGMITRLALDAQGDIVAGGGPIASFDGAQWTTLPAMAPGTITSLLPDANGDLVVGVSPVQSELLRSSSVRRFDGTIWHELNPGVANVQLLATLPDDDVIVTGQFTSIGGTTARNIARFDGSSYHALGSGIDGVITCIGTNADGLVVVGGDFVNGPGGSSRVALWNGTAWSSVGAGLPFVPVCIAIDRQGRVLATSAQQYALFDGLAWQTLPQPAGGTNAVIAVGNGEFLLAGTYTPAGGGIADGLLRYSGGGYTVEPCGIASAGDVVQLRDGSIVAVSGNGTPRVARLFNGIWSQQSFTNLPLLQRVRELANGDLCAVTAASQSQLLLLHANGTTSTDALQLLPTVSTGEKFGLTTTRDGRVMVAYGSRLIAADGVISAAIAMATPHCPAAASAIGTGCIGAAGAVTMAATDLPWLGSTFHAEVTGMAVPTIGLHLAGVTPLSLALPLGAPGCTLQVDPVLIGAFVPSSQQSEVAFAVPNAPVLVGQQLLTQVVALELDAMGAISRTTASNALQLTVGAF